MTGAIPAPPGVTIRRARPEDAAAYAAADAEFVAATYDHLMPPEFGQARRAEVPQCTAEYAEWFAESAAAEARGEEPFRRYWIARADATSEVLGLVHAGVGPERWESEYTKAAPPTEYCLSHLYTAASTHGTGLGQALLDVAVGDRDAYLWLVVGNDRARRFYERNGFTDEGVGYECGPLWFHRPMRRLLRRR